MKKLLAIAIMSIASSLDVWAQQQEEPFRAHLFNKEYDISLHIDLYNESITVPGQELYGALPGYLNKRGNSFCWVITAAKVKGNKAKLSLINDFGSEDLTATLTVKDDSIYILRQEDGNTLKVPKDGKWQKLPKTLEFRRK